MWQREGKLPLMEPLWSFEGSFNQKSTELWAFPSETHVKSAMLENTEKRCLDSYTAF